MAFYTSRVDDNGNEIERRHSARSLATSISSSSTRLNLSSRSCGKPSVRIMNPATYIDKTADQSEASSVSEDVSSKYLSHHTLSESQSDIVPPLDLQSEENYPTTRDYTFSYRKHCEAANIVLKPDKAFETWLSAKRKLISDKAANRKKAEEQKREEMELRKRLSEAKFQSWLEKKSQKQNNNKSRDKVKHEAEEKPTKPQISEEEVQARLEEWDRVKRLEDERRRMLKRQEEERRRELEEQRRQMAAEAWEKWISEAANKPKPVPLNRGIFTLRGTVSEIFVNPNEWKSTSETIKEED